MSTPDSSDSPPVAAKSAWAALGVTTLAFFLSVVDVSAVNVAFPSIKEDFGVSRAYLSWIISGYNIVIASGLLVAGRLADSLGRKKLFLPGVFVFMIGSLLSGLAPSVNALIAARVIQAVGGAVVSASSMAVVLPEFPLAKRGTVIGIAGATGALGAVAGPAIGSVLIDLWSWRGIFLINVPLCLIILAIGPRLLNESKNPDATGRIDFVGVVIGTAAVALTMLGIVRSESVGVSNPTVIGLIVVGITLLVAVVRRSKNHPEPVIDLSLFKLQSFSSTTAASAAFSAAFTAGFLSSSLLLQDLWDQPIRTTGLALMPSPFLAALVSPLAGRFADRFGHRWLLGAGSLLCALAYASFYLFLNETPQVFTRFVPLSLILGLGVGLSIATWSSAGLADVEPARFGVANAVIRTVQQCSYALGISMVIALMALGGGGELASYRLAWLWVIGCYALAGIIIMARFPDGSAQDRSRAVPATR